MITFRKLNPHAALPTRATAGSVCYDAEACLMIGDTITSFNSMNDEGRTQLTSETIMVGPGDRILVPLGWAVKLPQDVSMRIYSRSGLALKQGLIVANGEGIVDADYRHQVYAIIANVSKKWVSISHGARICQVEFVPRHNYNEDIAVVDDVSDVDWFDSDRKGGFGSTGVLTTNANGVILH